MKIKAVQKFVRMSPRKLRLVVPLVKNLPPSKAVEVLPHVGKRASEPLAKTIKTAIANAKQAGASERDLIFKEIQINEGPRLKRWRAGAKGRIKPYKRRMSHIRVVLATKEPEAIKGAREKVEKEKGGKGSVGKSDEKPATQKALRKKGSKTQRKSAKSAKKSA